MEHYYKNKYVKCVTIFLCVFQSGQLQCFQVITWNWCCSATIDSL